MSLSARIALDPSRRVAWAERAVPLLGLVVAAATLAVRWPAAAIPVLVAAAFAVIAFVRWSGPLRPAADPYRLSLSDRPEFGVVLPDGSSIDARLVESTVAWPGFWMLALGGAAGSRVTRLAVSPSELHADARRALGRFVLWATRTVDRADDRNKPVR